MNLGALRVSEKVEKQVTIVNSSLISLTLSLSLLPHGMSSHQLQEDGDVLSVEPADEVTLRPKNGTAKVTVKFAPKARIPHFQEEVSARIRDTKYVYQYPPIANVVLAVKALVA